VENRAHVILACCPHCAVLASTMQEDSTRVSVSISYSGSRFSKPEEQQNNKEIVENICYQVRGFSFRYGARFGIFGLWFF